MIVGNVGHGGVAQTGAWHGFSKLAALIIR